MDNVTHLVPSLKLSHVHIKDWKRVEAKIQTLISGKQENLQVIADFDFTLTKFHINGQKLPSTYGVIESYSNWPHEYKEAINTLKNKYHKIDNDPNKTIKEKTPILMDILRNAFKIMQKSSLNRLDFKLMVEESSIQLREGTLDFFEDLNRARVPFLIISAGLGNVILQVLNNHNLMTSNLNVIANHMEYYSEKEMIDDDHSDRLVLPYNKESVSFGLSTPYFADFSHRKNIIVLGDSLGDLHMSSGAGTENTILTIGFLNEKIEESLQIYKDSFDIVLVDDQTMNIPHSLIKLATV